MELVKNKALFATLLAMIAAVPGLSFAQSTTPITRAQVHAELAELRSVGYQGGHRSRLSQGDRGGTAAPRGKASSGRATGQ